MRKSRQLIFSDVGVSRAHLDVSDIHWQSTNTTTSPTVSRPNQANPALPANLSAFRIDRVSFEDVLITNRHTGFHLEIPKIEWTGFKVTDDAVEPGNITVQSDRLDIRTRPGRTVPIAGKPFPFQKTLEISAKPQLHPALRQPLACLVDFSLPPRGEMMSWHIAAADGAIEASGSGGSGQISVRDFDAARLLDSAALFGRAAPDLPTDLTFKLTTTSDPAAWRLAGGQFRLGTAQFEIHPCVSPRQLAIPAVIRAVAHVGPEEISWLLPVPAADEFPPFQPRFSANPEIPLPAVLALVFFGKPYAELSAAERAAIDAKVPAYTPPVPPPPATGGQ
jgi:hypothetical protein